MRPAALFLFFVSNVMAQDDVCEDTCGAVYVHNNRCDEYGDPPLCAKGTDCSDCRIVFPIWQIIIASTSAFVLIFALVAMFFFHRSTEEEVTPTMVKVQDAEAPPLPRPTPGTAKPVSAAPKLPEQRAPAAAVVRPSTDERKPSPRSSVRVSTSRPRVI